MKINRSKNSKLSGQSLVEVIVALTAVIVLALSLVTASLITQKAARSARNKSQATKLVQQNLEQMRAFRDRKGFGAVADGGCYTLSSLDPDPANWALSVCTTGEVITLNNTNFTRKIAIITDALNSNKKLVTVTVTWADSSGTQTVANKTYLANWCKANPLGGPPCP